MRRWRQSRRIRVSVSAAVLRGLRAGSHRIYFYIEMIDIKTMDIE